MEGNEKSLKDGPDSCMTRRCSDILATHPNFDKEDIP